MRHAELLEHRWKPVPPADPAKIAFKDYGEDGIATRDLGPKTRAEYQRMSTGPRLTRFHSLTLDAITPTVLKSWWDAQTAQRGVASGAAQNPLRRR